MTRGYINVYEDESGHIRAYVHESDGVKLYDSWERFDSGDLCKCVYEWMRLGIMDGVDAALPEEYEVEDEFSNMLIVSAYRYEYGGGYIYVFHDGMGPNGKHAWGIKEED